MNAIDLFAGAGGFSTGATMAGVNVLWAANHWPAAVQVHANNHPLTKHLCQDLQQADWTQVPPHDLLLGSPCCQGHSRARGKDRPHHDAQRSTAWAIVSALEFHRPQAAVIENVKEFISWQLFPAWKHAMNALGYSLSPMELDAADSGVPQHRQRLFIVATRSKNPIQLKLPRREHVPVASVLDFDSGNWSPIQKPGRSHATLRRVHNGRHDHGDRFVMPYYGSGSGLTGRSIHRPLGTITTRARWALVDGDRMRMLTLPENRDIMGFPKDYQLPKSLSTALHMLGNAVCPRQAADVIEALKEQA